MDWRGLAEKWRREAAELHAEVAKGGEPWAVNDRLHGAGLALRLCADRLEAEMERVPFDLARDCTLVLAVDRRTFEFLKVSAPTWKRHRPELFRCRWCVFMDDRPETGTDLDSVVQFVAYEMKLPAYLLRVRHWPRSKEHGDQFGSQRETMLTAFCMAGHFAETPWTLKIDCDALALDGSKPWPLPEWFEGEPAWVASSWSYSRPKSWNGTTAEWCEALEAWGDRMWPGTERLGLSGMISESGGKILHKRHASWCAFYNTAWLWEVFPDALARLPVPSQDSCCDYASTRRGDPTVFQKMKRVGFTNVPSLDRLKAKAAEAMK